MTGSRRRRVFPLLALGALVLVLAATSCSKPKRPPIAEQIAKTYGLDSFGQIEAIRYTFNAEFSGGSFSRSWVWQPKTGQVSYEGKDKDGNPVKATYVRSQLNSQPANVKDDIDPAFSNDEYNLIFPFHVYWDTSADVQDLGMQKPPLGTGEARRVVVKYPAESGGATPGDTWEIFIGSDGRIQTFIYRRSGPRPPSLVVQTWEGYKKAGPLLVATERRGTADGKPVHIFFSDVAVKLAGSDAWVNAQ
jgi:hypothetical protein